jgi:hypothetical protein
MRFRVPQFIDVEDKLFGPLTFKQFVYLAGGGGIVYFLFKALPFYISIFLILPIAALSLSLAFYKVNSRPFIFYLQSIFSYIFSSRVYVWKQRKLKPKTKEKEEENYLVINKNKNSISTLSRELDTNLNEE